MNEMNNNWHSNVSNKNREEIILIGKELFINNNFHNVKITDICTLAGVSRVTFYKHFNTVDELIFEVQMNILNNMTRFIEDRIDLSVNGKESVKTVLYAWIDFAKKYKDEMKFIVSFDLYYSYSDLNEDLKLKYENFTTKDYTRSLLKYALDKGINDGSLKVDIEPIQTGLYIHQTVMGVLQRMSYTKFAIGSEYITFDEIAVRVVEMIMSSIENG